MKRSGFKPKHPPKPPRQWEGPAPVQAPVRATLGRPDGKARLSVPVPKRQAVRSTPLREAYRLLPCQFEREDGSLCGRMDGTVCCCHSNFQKHGKGLSLKADDSRAAAGCSQCHAELDQGRKWSANERRRQFDAAHARSVRLLVERGLWPLSVPVPDIENNPWENA